MIYVFMYCFLHIQTSADPNELLSKLRTNDLCVFWTSARVLICFGRDEEKEWLS